jgi:hypothetical protein
VIYVPDCSGWALLSQIKACEFLLGALQVAFSNDPNLKMSEFDELKFQDSVESMLDEVAFYCQKNELQLYAIFDQHNALANVLEKFPFCVPHRTLLNLSFWKRNCVVIISASANNGYHLEV